ncbi:DUF4886 domain-containing protein [Microbulbifer sp. TRSA002]|uniref:DUF4886 domain-containing protein n=1 Tax=Microbulbifer sp. TRSA002 TaxID=3243382 RepID=UPI0040395394
MNVMKFGKPLFFFISLALISLAACQAERNYKKQVKVLFIGNSYTVPLPVNIQEISRMNGVDFHFKAIAPGGWTLQKHASSENTLSAIRQRDWDFIVLQEQSQLPSFSVQQRQKQIVPYVEKLCDEIYEAGAKPVLYLTWGRKKGDIRNLPNDTRSEMQKRLIEGYQEMADICEATIVPVGTIWEQISSSTGAINLYASDGSHPNTAGILLASLLFTRYFSGDSLKVEGDFENLSIEEVSRFVEIVNNTNLGVKQR